MDKKVNRLNDRIVKLKLYDGIDGTILERWCVVVNAKNKKLGVRMILRLMEWYGIGMYDITNADKKQIEEELDFQKGLINN